MQEVTELSRTPRRHVVRILNVTKRI